MNQCRAAEALLNGATWRDDHEALGDSEITTHLRHLCLKLTILIDRASGRCAIRPPLVRHHCSLTTVLGARDADFCCKISWHPLDCHDAPRSCRCYRHLGVCRILKSQGLFVWAHRTWSLCVPIDTGRRPPDVRWTSCRLVLDDGPAP